MRGLSWLFLMIAVGHALAGMALGLYMGATGDHAFAPAHAHNNLLGWVGMALYGLFYAAVPQAARMRLATWHFVLAVLGNLTMPLGIAFLSEPVGQVLAPLGSLCELAAMLLFAVVVWRSRDALALKAGEA